MAGEDAGTTKVHGWDPLVRLTHWGIAAAVLVNGLLTEGDSQIHVWIGYAAAALLALRLVWGVLGPTEARFSAFPPSLSAARAHVQELIAGRRHTYRSHNPLGSLMVYALWGTLAVVAATGIGMVGSPFQPFDGSAAVGRTATEAGDHEGRGEQGEHDEREHEANGEEDDEHEGPLEEIHEVAADLLLILAALHVGGVLLEVRLSGPSFVRSMVTGERRGPV